MYNARKNGFSLIETLIIVSIIMVAGLASYMAYVKISESKKVTDEVNDIKRIIEDVKTITNQKNYTYSNLDANFLAAYKTINPHKVLNNKYSNNLGSITTFSSNYVNKNVTHLKVTYENMTGEHCAILINQYENSVDFISVHNTLIKNTMNNHNENYQFHRENAFSACQNASENYKQFNLILFFNLSR